MRGKAIYLLSALAAIALVRSFHAVLLEIPHEGRLMAFQTAAALTALAAFIAAPGAAFAFLVTKNFLYDSLAVAIAEVSLAFACVNMVTRACWSRIVWGIWWTWDAPLTMMFVCFLLYLSYLVLRTAIDEPSQRAMLSAVFAIFALVDMPVIWYSIERLRGQRPVPNLAGGAMYWTSAALMLIAAILILIRMRQEELRREIDGLRRLAHAV